MEHLKKGEKNSQKPSGFFYYYFREKKNREYEGGIEVGICPRSLLLGFREGVRYRKENIIKIVAFCFGYGTPRGILYLFCTSIEVTRWF